MLEIIIVGSTAGLLGVIIGHYIGAREQKKILDTGYSTMVGLLASSSLKDIERVELDLSTDYMEEELTKRIFTDKLLNYQGD